MGKTMALAVQRQLFIDDQVIDETLGLAKVLHQPMKYAGNPIVRPTKPWEGSVNVYGTVMYDEDLGLFRMWYQGYGGGDYTGCYATSRDGIFWDKPVLGLVDFQGSKKNNLFILDAAVLSVIKDTREEDPERVYKAFFFDREHSRRGPTPVQTASVAFSPDGIRWTKYRGNPVIPYAGDTHTLLGWDEAVGKYVAYPRPGRPREGPYVRRIGRSVSDDFINWTEPEEVMAPDEQDPPALEFYGMPVFKYEGLYIGLPWAYHAYPEEPFVRMAATVDTQLAVSRDGIRWQRAGDRKPFIPLGPPGSSDQGMLYGAKEPLVMGDELWFYYGAYDGDHGLAGSAGRIHLAKLRRDGFVSVDGSSVGGALVTRPMRCDGGQLIINSDARGGTVEVAVLDERGVEIGGYRKIDCAVFDGDSVRHKVTWRDHVTLDGLAGQAIRLKFYLRSARLYSFGTG